MEIKHLLRQGEGLLTSSSTVQASQSRLLPFASELAPFVRTQSFRHVILLLPSFEQGQPS